MSNTNIQISDVLMYLRPNGGWVIYGEDFATIRYDEGVIPISKKELDKGFTEYNAWKSQQDVVKATAKATAEAKLSALGLTTDDLRVLGL